MWLGREGSDLGQHDTTDRSEPDEFSGWHVTSEAARSLLPPGVDLAALITKIGACGWEGEIVGPRGVGKSLLLRELEAHCVEREIECVRWECSLDSPNLPNRWWLTIERVDLVLLDGAESVRVADRRELRRKCRELGTGLIVTTHERIGLRWSFPVRCSLGHLERMLSWLFPDETTRPARATVERLYRSRGGNIREILMQLHLRHLRVQRATQARRASSRSRTRSEPAASNWR